MLNDLNYRELIYIDSTKNEPDFSLETLDEYIKQIIEENQYNLENYKRLLEKNETTRLSHLYTHMNYLDLYFNGLGDDAGCDEGPSYWFAAGASA